MNMQQKKQKDFKAACDKLSPYPIIAGCILLLTIVMMLASWAEVYNTDINGPEVKVKGFSFLLAAITGNYTSASSLYGDIAVPFYYYAGSYTVKLAVLTLVTFILTIATMAVELVSFLKKNAALNCAAAVLGLATTLLLFVSFAVARSMNGSDILPVYCSSNPACSVRSYLIFPAIFALLSLGVNIAACIKYFQARKLLS